MGWDTAARVMTVVLMYLSKFGMLPPMSLRP